MDNATYNDTMIEVFEENCQAKAINFSAIDSRIRCMPHTAHLAALKVSAIRSVVPTINSDLVIGINWGHQQGRPQES